MIAGPTGVGKTSISIAVARILDSEIISADSRQVFRQMRIGTARPGKDLLQAAAHHFIADRNLDDPYSAGIFAREAEERIGQIIARGHSPLVVGGSTLYLRALVEGLADIPVVDPEIRLRMNRRLHDEGAGPLYEELCAVDPAFASTLDASKSQRIIRGLEVWHGTGKPISEYFTEQSTPDSSYTFFILDRERSELYARINTRVDRMISEGLVDEVISILDAGFGPEVNALQTIGYREAVRYLNGDCSLDVMTSEIKKNTRRYAKRQLTWFRGLSEARWIMVTQKSDDAVTAEIVTVCGDLL